MSQAVAEQIDLGLPRTLETRLLRLRSPERIQSFINHIPWNSEPDGHTARSVVGVLEHDAAHCIEAAFVAAAALALGLEVDKDPRKVQAILDESNEVVRKRQGVLIVEHRLGFVQANAGIDQSNIAHEDDVDDSLCLLLPVDPDASAERIRVAIKQFLGVDVGVIINDSLGRAWRNGSLGLAIGVAGFTALEDYVGKTDIYGRELKVTLVAAADEMAAGASLVMGQTSEKAPAVLVRGYRPKEPEDLVLRGVKPLIRPKAMDLFR